MKVTNFRRSDGFGAQYQTIVFSVLYADLLGVPFVYTPLDTVEHNYSEDPQYVEKLEEFINIKNFYKHVDTALDTKVLSKVEYQHVEQNLDTCLTSQAFRQIKALFHENKVQVFDKEVLHIAVHIRRSNKFDIGDYGYTEDAYYHRIISHIRNSYEEAKTFHIYSQGSLDQFESFKSEDTVFHLDEPIESTFYSMVTADILVMSKGSFSYTAALLSDGIVYYLPFWHKPSSKWQII
jgi:hypothetical protein